MRRHAANAVFGKAGAGAGPGEFMGRGLYGQYLYIDQRRDVVIVTTAADRFFREPGENDRNVETFRGIAETAEGFDGAG